MQSLLCSRLSFLASVALITGLGAGCTITTASTDAGTDADAGGGTGADSGGSTGADSGTPGVDSGPAPQVGNGCADPRPSNQTRETATPYTIGTAFKACLKTDDDMNFYSFTVPSTPAKGGYVIVYVTDVGATGNIDMIAQAVKDNGEFAHTYAASDGQSAYLYFAARAGDSYRLRIQHFASQGELAYTLKATFTGVPDAHAPNDTQKTAAALTAGTATDGYYFAGYDVSSPPAATAWDSWYKVTLPAGTAHLELTNTPSDITASVELFDGLGQHLDNKYSATDGASVVLDTAAPAAGDYYVKVAPFSPPGTLTGTVAAVPQYFTQPYSLKVSSK